MYKKILGLICIVALSACAEGIPMHNCIDDGIDEALLVAKRQWPDIAPVADRLEVFCVSKSKINSFPYCGRSGFKDNAACTVWLGSDFPVLGKRARVYVADGVSVSKAILHESQHWHQESEFEGCSDHREECWNYSLPEE